MHARAGDVLAEVAELLSPPRRMRPSAAAAAYLRNERGAWSPEFAPMMLEPLDMLAERAYRGIVYVGPARTGKTSALVLGGVAYMVACAPGDALIVQMTADAARDFSRTEIDRMFRHSPELAARLSPRPRDDNIHEKFMRSGAQLKIAWPVISNLSSRTVQYVLLADYERASDRDNVGGEGTLWDLALKRTETFMSRGKVLAEASPGDDYAQPGWKPATAHEAPPARGIAALYNAGTRARWYWPCKHCGEFFQAAPGLAPFALPEFEQLEELVQREDLNALSARFAHVACPSCGASHDQVDKPALNAGGRWVHEGELINAAGEIISGDRRRAPIASYWQGGCSAIYQRWDSMLYRYLSAVLSYVRLGDESQLKTVTNTDLAASYMPRSIAKRRSGAELRKRIEAWPRGTVPAGVRFLTAGVDVQAAKFVVQVHGWGVQLESWLVDRFSISASKRAEGARTAAVDPAGYLEDWGLLREAVIARRYPLAEAPDESLGITLTACDSGGRAGVSARAYEFWRSLRRDGLGRRLCLVKGTGAPQARRVTPSFPDSSGRKDRAQGGRGDVPVWLLNVNVLKDAVANDLAREAAGPGYVHLPEWLDSEVFDELTAEMRTAKGWVRQAGARNEALDLAVYNRACTIILRAERINWQRPPRWASEPAGRAKAEAERRAQPSVDSQVAAELRGETPRRRKRGSGRPGMPGYQGGWMNRKPGGNPFRRF